MRRALVILMTLLLMMPILAACGGGSDDDSDTSSESNGTTIASEDGAQSDSETGTETEAETEELQPLTIGIIPVGIYAPVMLAHDKGYFEDAGIDAELKPLAGGGDMVTLTANGNFDIGIGGAGPSFFNAVASGIDLTIISPLHFEKEPQATPLMVSKERYESGELDSIEKLEGKKISVNARGATEYWLDQALETGGLSIEDIDLKELPFSDVPAALESGSLDAAMLGEPIATRAEQEGIAVRLVDGFATDFQPTFVYVNPQFAEDNPELVTNFMQGYLRGCRDLMADDWASDENLAIIEEYTGVSPDLIRESARTYCEPNGEVHIDDLATLQEFFAERGLLEYEELFDVNELVDSSYAEAAVKEIGRAGE